MPWNGECVKLNGPWCLCLHRDSSSLEYSRRGKELDIKRGAGPIEGRPRFWGLFGSASFGALGSLAGDALRGPVRFAGFVYNDVGLLADRHFLGDEDG